MSKITCKVCGKEISKSSFLNHLKFHHSIDSYYNYGKQYKLNFIRRYIDKDIVLFDFNNQCKLCKNEFLMKIKDSNSIEIIRCLTTNCSKKTLKKSLLQCLNENDESYKLVYDSYELNMKKRSDIEHISKVKGISLEEAQELRNNHNKLTSGSLENYIRRYGSELGTVKYNEFCKKSAITLENYVIKFGEDEGYRKWVNYKTNLKNNSSCTLSYWLRKTNGNIEEAKKLLYKRQSFDLEYIINKYGEEEGRKRYESSNKLRAITLENMIRVHGNPEGIEKYHDYIYKIGYFNTLDGKIEKYGPTVGLQKYNDSNKLKHWNSSKSYSNKSQLFFEILINLLGKSKYTYYYADNEWFVYFPKKIYFIDFYIKELNYAIEFNGDFWHANPKIYNGDEFTYRGILAKDIWEKDRIRHEDLKQKIKNIDIVWEKDYESNLDEVLFNITSRIEEIEHNVL